MNRLETAAMLFLRAIAGYRVIDKRRNEDMRKGFKATRLKDHQRKWWEHEERMEDQQIPKHTFQI
jgi:hypothetical protein